jgi:hypothetical protein
LAGKQHTVRQGESVESIAHAAGHFWETVWDAPENAELRELRKTAHVVHPGDVVFVPDPEPRTESLATGRKHVMRRKGVPSELTVRFLLDGEPRASAAYVFVIDGEERQGSTDGDGWLREPVHPEARRAEVRFTLEPVEDPDLVAEPADDDAVHEGPELPEPEPDEPLEEVFHFDLRHMDPSSEVSGAQGRLHLLGYRVDGIDGQADDAFREALSAFQADHELEVTGELDDATQAKLKEFTDG